TELMTLKVMALARILCPKTNIPATTALATINADNGHSRGLQRGANVIMPNLTPERYKTLYEIYPLKSGMKSTHEQIDRSVKKLINSMGREIGCGPGSRQRVPYS
ncbi:MAG: [FeFe] hydrogenase H-cluster radical SAM maturase HydE, partial [bacterium]|nr:[FeFe] hydrogenase H-cluster radical SAM maturase HydE [bacterium]